jgi:hypothetical protein
MSRIVDEKDFLFFITSLDDIQEDERMECIDECDGCISDDLSCSHESICCE